MEKHFVITWFFQRFYVIFGLGALGGGGLWLFDYNSLTSLILNYRLFWSNGSTWFRQKSCTHSLMNKKISGVKMRMRGQAYRNFANTLKTACGSGTSCTRCNFSLSSKPYSILSLWLSPCFLGTLSTLGPPEPWDMDFHSRPLLWLQTCPIQFHFMRLFLIQEKIEWAVDAHGCLHAPQSWFYRSQFFPPNISLPSK